MRLAKDIQKSGFFWLPSNPNHKIPGNIKIVDGGAISLEVVGLFDESVEGLNNALNGKSNIKRIVGNIEKYGFVTLDYCFYSNINMSFGGISKSSVHVGRAILGVAYDDNEEINISSFRFTTDGLSEWVNLSGISVEHDLSNKSAIIKYSPLENINIDINDGVQLAIVFEWTLPGFANKIEAKITQKTYLDIISNCDRPLQDFVAIARKITNFLCFAIDQTVCMQNVSFKSKISNEEEVRIVSSDLFYKSLPFTDTIPKIEAYKFLFRFDQIKDNASIVINSWLNAYEIIYPSLNLYFSAKTGGHRYIEGNFLALAQCLETYHRRTSSQKFMEEALFNQLTQSLVSVCPDEFNEWLTGRLATGNEITLTQRIKNIIEPYKEIIGSSNNRGKLIWAIVKTRNYLTHYDEKLTLESCEGVKLINLCFKIEAIFQLHILQMLGFTHSEILSIFKNSESLKFKISRQI